MPAADDLRRVLRRAAGRRPRTVLRSFWVRLRARTAGREGWSSGSSACRSCAWWIWPAAGRDTEAWIAAGHPLRAIGLVRATCPSAAMVPAPRT